MQAKVIVWKQKDIYKFKLERAVFYQKKYVKNLQFQILGNLNKITSKKCTYFILYK